MAATIELASNAVVNLIGQIQAAMAPHPMVMRMSAMSADSPPVPGGGGGGTNGYTPDGGPDPMPDPGTNLWLAETFVASGYLNAIGSNTMADIFYEIQSRTNLAQTDWQSEGFISGSEITNWTPLSVFQNGRTNLFIRLRSWIDSFGIGIPDWWQIEYFGTNGIDPNASAAGDGFSNLYKFQNGLVPTNYFNPNGPPGFFGYLDATGTNVFIAWSPAPGPVVNYSIQRGISNSVFSLYTYSQVGTVSSNANFIEDVGAINNSNALNNIYQLEAVYPAGSLSATDTWQVSWFSLYGTNGMPFGPPAPTNFYACADTNAANVLLSWTPASGVATNYLIERGIFNTASNVYVYHQIAAVSPATNTFKVSGPFTNASNWSDNYAIAAIYPGNVAAPLAISPVNVGNTNSLAAPASFYGYADGTGTNLVLAWTPAAGTPVNYVLFEGNTNSLGAYAYVKLATVNGTSTNLVVANGINNLYQAYAIFAVYPDGSLSQATFWQSANGTPAPGNFIAYFDATGTNVWLSWTAPTGAISGYLISRFDPLGDVFEYNVSSSTTFFEDTNAVNTGSFDPVYTQYTVQALYPQGGASPTAVASVGSLPTPTGLTATLDVTGKNVNIAWVAVPGAVNYVIERGVMNPATGTYTYSAIETVGPGITSFTDNGAILTANSYNNRYEVEAIFPGGVASAFSNSGVSESSTVPLSNVYVSANLIRNGTGRWQVMFSGLPTNSPQTIQLSWTDGYENIIQTNLSTTNLVGGVYQLPDAWALDVLNYELDSGLTLSLTVQLFGPNGEPGQIQLAGYFPQDAPYFVDGRQHMKQNLQFLIRAASINQLFYSSDNAGSNGFNIDGYFGQYNETSTNFEEFSFLHHLEPTLEDLNYFELEGLWPFTANYELANYLTDTTRTTNSPYGSTNFTFAPDFTTNVPAPAILNPSNPYWILQPGFHNYLIGFGGNSPANWGVNVSAENIEASLNSGHNLFGLPYSSGYIVANTNNGEYNYQALSPGGGNVAAPPGYLIDDYASWCPAPTLQTVNYYFAPLFEFSANDGFFYTTGVQMPGEIDPTGGADVQPFPVPIEDDFKVTNQTPPIIASVGQPMVIGGWAKYSVQGSSPTKYAYLGQYFVTNAFLLNSNGIPTTNSAGVISPYGEFFPLQTGVAQFTTMADIDPPYGQGTNVVRIISMNVDANHDGVMDLSYAGPDQTSPSRPFRFWVNDNQDAGDDGGNFGVPGATDADGITPYSIQDTNVIDNLFHDVWCIHGRRDLVDFFPVYLNIGSLFQSNSLSTGISVTDTNYQFVLSQADGALRFGYTDLTPTNYMNFLQDTNESDKLVYQAGNPIFASLTTITTNGAALSPSFVGGMAASNQGIILVEAWTNTAQPLVLTIYHGTNQIAQTSLPLSITGVEQMFRSKTIYLNSTPGFVPDRLTDGQVPNEPDTTDKNFVFLHGYNVLPQEARGVAADMYKRMYWSGSHAKFWAVTWEGADSKIGNVFTPNYHTNVVDAFGTAPLLANFIASLTNSGPVVVAAHSLGNMVTLSAISDWNAPISQFFMLDAAVPIEAIDPTATTNMMILSTWTGYTNRLFCSDWYQLFPTNDARSTLTWNNRLGNLRNVDVYNFYSSGEEVLRTTTNDPPPGVLGILATQATYHFWDNFPFGTFTWYWQEKGKGPASQDWFLCSSHGGWKFNQTDYGTNEATGGLGSTVYWVPMSPSSAATLTGPQLQTTPFFSVSSDTNIVNPITADNALLGSGGSNYAQANRNRILADAIPAMSEVAGANPVTILDQPGQSHNIDMMTLENGWSSGRKVPENNKWHHSDFVQMAYTFTYKLFNQFVTTGNLK